MPATMVSLVLNTNGSTPINPRDPTMTVPIINPVPTTTTGGISSAFRAAMTK